MSILGLDYGKAKVGVALATGILAEPLTTLNTQTSIQLIRELITKHNVDKIIIGEVSEEFLAELNGLGLEVKVVDETLSSHDARESLLHTTRKRRRELEHAAAATIILQNWLDYHD